MKKKLREQLTALAKQIIEDEKTFKTTSAKESVAKLYEKLVVLEYLEKQLEGDTGHEQEDSLDSKSFREENWFTEPEPVPQPEEREDIVEPLMEKIKDLVAQMPEEGQHIDQLLEEMLPQNNFESPVNEDSIVEDEIEFVAEEEVEVEVEVVEKITIIETEKPAEKYIKNELEEFASNYQRMPEFERKQTQLFPETVEVKESKKPITETRAKSLNDSVNKGLNIGLNDRLAFIKHLFEGQVEDYTRVLSQINTMGSYKEAESFIKANVKPDYNYWVDKEVYSERFMHIIEKRFN